MKKTRQLNVDNLGLGVRNLNINDVIVRHEIEMCIIEIARGYDYRDWDAVRKHLSDDIKAEMGDGLLDGPEMFVANVKSYLDRCGTTQHLLGNLIVSANGDEAESKCYVSDMHLGLGERVEQTFATLGDYHDKWRKVDGRWRLVYRQKLNRGFIGSIDIFS